MGGVHEKAGLPEAFHGPRTLPSPRKKCNYFKLQSIVQSHFHLKVGLEFETSLLSNHQTIPPHPTPVSTLTISIQILTNYETHIFKNWGGMYPQTHRGSAYLADDVVEDPPAAGDCSERKWHVDNSTEQVGDSEVTEEQISSSPHPVIAQNDDHDQ